MTKRLTREQILGEKGVNLIGRKFLDLGFPWHPTNAPLDAGIDGFIEIRDSSTGEVTNSWIAVQSKAKTNLEQETDVTFSYSCTARDLEYWLRGNMPVLLVVSRPDTEEAWWVDVKSYFRDASALQTRKIIFSKVTCALGTGARDLLLGLAQAAGSGTYFRPAPKHEHLDTNLLLVTRLPACIYRAESKHTDPRQFHSAIRQRMEYPPVEWFLHSGVVYSVHDLRDEPWAANCDLGTAETIGTDEWADSEDPEISRQFVRLLGLCLQSFGGRLGMRYDRTTNMLFFKKTTDLSPRIRQYRSRQQAATRTVFREYRKKSDPSQIAYYRHTGFEPYFRRFDGQWCLEINPTYRFTSDGVSPHPFREEYLSKIKSLEGSGAVGGLVVMFASLFRDRHGLFVDNYPHVGFGELLGIDMPVGIDDALWAKRDALAVTAMNPGDDEGFVDDDLGSSLFQPEDV